MEEEHLLISQLRARRERVEVAESIIPLTVVDLKGKAVKTPSKKPKKKRKIKASIERMSKTAKLLASAMYSVTTTNEYLELYFELCSSI